jgi:hypothetical protein
MSQESDWQCPPLDRHGTIVGYNLGWRSPQPAYDAVLPGGI